MQADVVVIGGGPVGMLMAAELAGYGIRTVVFEALAEVSRQPKATTLHARAVQSLVRRGRLPWLAPVYQEADFQRPFRFAGLAGLTITAPGTEPEPLLKCAQVELEEAFESQARAAGARILRGYRVSGLSQDSGCVSVVAEQADAAAGLSGAAGPVVCTARYVVGADGARSAVRRLAGIESDTWPATVSSMMGLVTLPDRSVLSPGWHRTSRGWIVATPTSGDDVSVRTLNPEPSADWALPLTAQELQHEVEWIAGRAVPMSNLRWLKRFSDFARLARGYRHGRVILVGDAAHSHFPIGGQGLSAGLLDAVNLGWKLAHEVHGTAAAGLLDSYEAERRPAARRVIDATRAQLVFMRPDPDMDGMRALLAERLSDGLVNGRVSAMISGQSIVAPARSRRPSTWEGKFLTNRRLGTDRGWTDVVELLGSGRAQLLLFGGGSGRDGYRVEAAPWTEVLNIVEVDAEPDIPYEALLVRPDGYVGWVPEPAGESLADALAVYFGHRPVRTAMPPLPGGTAADAMAAVEKSAPGLRKQRGYDTGTASGRCDSLARSSMHSS